MDKTFLNISNKIKNFNNNFYDKYKSIYQSNTYLSIFVFIIFVLILFFIFLYLGYKLILYLTKPPSSPYIVYGKINGNSALHILQDPTLSKSITLQKSNNRENGMEFTWSLWLYINTLPNSNNQQSMVKYNHIFNKGNSSFYGINNLNYSGIANVQNGPGLYLNSSKNSLRLVYDCVNSNNNQINNDILNFVDIDNIPIQKWVHVVIRLKNNILDIYINGVITSRTKLTSVFKQNFSDIFIGYNNGFSGNLSNLRYYDRAVEIFEINDILNAGPNINESDLSNVKKNSIIKNNYLSRLWYIN